MASFGGMSDETRLLSTPHQPSYANQRQMRHGDAADVGQSSNGNAHLAGSELTTITHDDYQYDSTPHAIH